MRGGSGWQLFLYPCIREQMCAGAAHGKYSVCGASGAVLRRGCCILGMQAGQIAFYAYVIPFLISTAGGAILSGILLGALRKTGILKTAEVR